MIIPKIQLLSVIIPTRGRSSKLINLLQELESQSGSTITPFEVVLVFDGDGTIPDQLYSYPLKKQQTAHVGAGGARNLGLRNAQGDAVLFLNDDVVPDPGFLDAHIDALNEGDLAVLGSSPWIASPNPTAFDGFIAHSPAIFHQSDLVDGNHYDFKRGWTLNLSMRRDVIDQLTTPFENELRPIYFEDIEFAYRCFGTEEKLKFIRAARAVHDHRMSIQDYFSREVLLGMMSVVLYDVNPECYRTIFESDPQKHAAIAAQTLLIDVRDHRKILDRFSSLAHLSQDSEASGEQAMILYDLHLPLKRRAFRLGLCEMCKQAVPWYKRVESASKLLVDDPVFSHLV